MYHQRTFCWYPRKTSISDSYLIIAETKGKLEGFVEAWISKGSGSHPRGCTWKSSPVAPAQSSQGGKRGLVLELLPFLEVLGASFVWQGGFPGDGGRLKEQPPTNPGSEKQPQGKEGKRFLKSWFENGHAARNCPWICVSSSES